MVADGVNAAAHQVPYGLLDLGFRGFAGRILGAD
jgi:hypothetical protein